MILGFGRAGRDAPIALCVSEGQEPHPADLGARGLLAAE
jgi:hypothetical protein